MNFEKEVAILPKSLLHKHRAPPQNQGRLLQVFLNQDLRHGHDGLAQIAKDTSQLDVQKLLPGQYLVFVNSAMDRIKLYASGNVVAYQVLPKGQKVDIRAIKQIPRVFQSTGKLDYDKALETTVQDYFTHKYPRISERQGKVIETTGRTLR
jgi:hypothetical protein